MISAIDFSDIADAVTALAALLAVFVGWRIPAKVAQLAEEMRRQSENEQYIRRMKMDVLSTLMQQRAQLHSPDGVKALNSIDIIFCNSPLVREAWAELFKGYNYKPYQGIIIEERATRLLQSIANDLGISENLRLDDFNRIYYPESILKAHAVQAHNTDAQFNALLNATTSGQQQINQPDYSQLFPPAPV